MTGHDPLLPPPLPSVNRTSRAQTATPTRRTRRPSPAASARILATGLATTAMLGLTTGYAFAKKAQQPQNSPTVDGTGTAANTGTNAATPSAPSQPQAPNSVAPTPDATSQQPVVTAPPVVEIPVPTVAPAQPGNNWNGGNNQPSSGSR